MKNLNNQAGSVIIKLLLVGVISLILVGAGLLVINSFKNNQEKNKTDSQPALAPTKTQTSPSPSGKTKNPVIPLVSQATIEAAIHDYLPEQLVSLSSGKGVPFCTYHFYGWEQDPKTQAIYAYIWAYCQEYYRTPAGELKTGTGISEPVKVVLEVQNGILGVQGHEEPKDGENYADSVYQMFPTEYAKAAINQPPDVKPLTEQVRMQAERYFAD